MDKKPTAKAKRLNKQKLGWIIFAVGCAVLLKRDRASAQNETYSSSSKGA